MNKPVEKDKNSKTRDSKVAVACVAFVGAMVGVSYAAVPLYEIFCQVTGYGGTTSRVVLDDYSLCGTADGDHVLISQLRILSCSCCCSEMSG